MADPLRIRVPASTSNLGPGFDALGVALSLWVEVRVLGPAMRTAIVEAEGEARAWPGDAADLVVRALERARGRDGGVGGLALGARSEVPLERGLGSSGAAIAAGLLLGDALAGGARSGEELLALGLDLEGHPDNLAPSLLGGARLCAPGAGPAGAPLAPRVEVHPDVGFAVAWPEARVPTARARAVLPASVPLGDAVETARRLALLLEGLRRAEPELVAAGGEDRLHVPHRLPLVPGAERALAAAREAGAWTATLSGSGSALLALGPRGRAEALAGAMADALRAATGTGTGRAVEVVADAPRVERGADGGPAR